MTKAVVLIWEIAWRVDQVAMLVSKLITHYMDSTYIVDIVREGVILDQGFEVEVGAIGGKEENAARDELIFGVVGLQFHASMSTPHNLGYKQHTFNFSASLPPYPVSTKTWRMFGSRRRALATHRKAARRTSPVSPSIPYRTSVLIPCRTSQHGHRKSKP